MLICEFISYFAKKAMSTLMEITPHYELCTHMNAVKLLEYFWDITHVYWKMGLSLQAESLKGIQVRDILSISKTTDVHWDLGIVY